LDDTGIVTVADGRIPYLALDHFQNLPKIILAGFNPLRQRLHGECPTGISNGVTFTEEEAVVDD